MLAWCIFRIPLTLAPSFILAAAATILSHSGTSPVLVLSSFILIPLSHPLQILAWRILWTEEPDRLQSIGSQIKLCQAPTMDVLTARHTLALISDQNSK